MNIFEHFFNKELEKYKEFIYAKPQLIEDACKELKGKDLVCWCAPQACHGEVLMEIANDIHLQ